MIKIDAHQHFWQYNPIDFAWITDDMKVIQKDFLPNDLGILLQTEGIDGCVAVQAPQTEQETVFLLELAEQHQFIKGVVGWVNLLAENVHERLAFFAQNKLFKGVRHIVQAEPDENFMLRADFQRGIAALSTFDLSYDILIFPPQLPAAIQLVRKFPQQRFVIDHLAKPYIKRGEIEPWKKLITTIAAEPNVYCKVSGMVTEADWKNHQTQDFLPYLDVVTQAFGTKRLMFGSDAPVCLVAASYGEVVNLVKNYYAQFSESEQNAIFGGNAIHFYQLA
jgi:L-fuconolactonase